MIAFVDAMLNCEGSGVKKVLVLSPVNAIHNWMNEYRHWIPLMECDYGVSVVYTCVCVCVCVCVFVCVCVCVCVLCLCSLLCVHVSDQWSV